MSDRTRAGGTFGPGARRGSRRLGFEALEGRQVLTATLAPIVGPVLVPSNLGFQLPVDGGADRPQTYTVTSDNPSVRASIARGQFLSIGVSHTSSGEGDPAFAGTIVLQLFEDLTPLTTSKIKQLVNAGFYTSPTDPSASAQPVRPAPLPSKNFHRVVPDFVVQGGSRSGDGSGSVGLPGFPFPDEFNQQLAFTGLGQLAMANSGDDTNDSQFFITFESPRNLDFQHTIFGQLVSGQETLALIEQVRRGGTDNSTPVNPILFTSTTLSDVNPDAVIHLDAVGALPGQSANVTVTATDPSDGTTASQTFQVAVVPDVGPDTAADPDTDPDPINSRAFLLPVENQVVGRNADGSTQTAVFQLRGVDSDPGDVLTFDVGAGQTRIDPNSSATIPDLPAAQGTATVDANGIVRVTPAQGFTGVITLTVGVRDQTQRVTATGATLNSAGNIDTQQITLTVTDGQPVNLRPIALSGTTSVVVNTPTIGQLSGDAANPGSGQSLTFSVVTPPRFGTITNLNSATGTFTYTPQPGFAGADFFTFRVRDVGEPTPNLDSEVAVQTLIVGLGTTGSVRQIGRVLVVTPPPRTDGGTNVIAVSRNGDNLQVAINGAVDVTQPAESSLDRIVIFGAKANDLITVAPDVTLPATLDGGHGGVNIINAGNGPSRLHGWFGRNTLRGGAQDDVLIGRAGRVRFRPSFGRDILFASNTKPPHTPGTSRPGGTFYRFINDRLVEVPPPRFPVARQVRRIPGPAPRAQTDDGSAG